MKKSSKKSTKSTENKKTTRALPKKATKASSKKSAKSPKASAASTTTGKKRGRPKKIDLLVEKKKTPKAVVVSDSTAPKSTKKIVRKKLNALDDITPVEASLSESYASTVRRNKSATIERTDRFTNIEDGLVPFKWSSTYGQNSNVTVKDAVILCQKTYYNFAIFRNVIDLMTEFSSSNIFFRGGNKKSKRFFQAFFKKIGLWSFQEKFFREYYRSGNVFMYRFDGKFKDKDINKITQTFGAKSSTNKLPVRWIILNPADIQMAGTLSFSQGKYFKVLTDYELHRLKNPQSDEDIQLLESLPKETREKLKNQSLSVLTMPLKADKVTAVFYKKQDYEPFAVPMGYPVLDDINWKAEMKKMDMAIARTMQQAILLVTMGTEPDKGGINQKNLEAMQKIFDNESVGRVLIADYTTKAEFVVPRIGDLLDSKKYEVVNEDIKQGLNNILVGQEKFANQNIKVKVFIERLRQAREAFINEFLYPEMRRISKILGFRNTPTPHFEDADIKDDVQFNRIYTRLIELGILTPEEGVTAIETGRLPDGKESIESQQMHKPHKDAGLFEPVIGGPFTQKEMQNETIKSNEKINTENLDSSEKINEVKIKNTPSTAPKTKQKSSTKKTAKENGRPPGSGTPQSTKNVKPIGGPGYGFSLSKIKDNMILAQKLDLVVQSKLREMHDIKRMSKKQKEVSEDISRLIVANENPKDWEANVEKYCKTPVDHNQARAKEVEDLAFEHQIDYYLASILYSSKCNNKREKDKQ
ncbi:hypothetical protein CMI37_07140 [Candidatus Pacearchaeota archaeon]|nr:hypothetical protein [Candidatus Pacearchaeota archaeon]